MKHVAMFSSGAGSAMAAKRAAERYGTDDLVLLFADVNGEDADNYRFLAEAHEWIGGTLVRLDNDGRTIWDVFKHKRFLGNSRIDPCSNYLKRIPMRRWLTDNCEPETTTIHIGYDWLEGDRLDRSLSYWAPWPVECPLMWEPMLDKSQVLDALAAAGIEPPLLTRQGFAHANCGGGCVKAGQAAFRHLLKVRPDTYAEWEAREQEMRDLLGDVAILTDRRNHDRKPFTLRQLREESGAQLDLFVDSDWGGCSCLAPAADD